MKNETCFDVERTASQLKILHEIMCEINGDARESTWEETNDKLWVLLDAMEPLVDGLYRYFAEEETANEHSPDENSGGYPGSNSS